MDGEWNTESAGTVWPRAIIHVDLDAFYASVEQLRNPALRGKPVIVGGASDSRGDAVLRRGVVSAASYEVRKFGVHSAMPLGRALRLCPHAIVVPVDFTAYRKYSSDIFEILSMVTPEIQPASLDEGYLDVTHSMLRFGSPSTMGRMLQRRILEETGLHASFGIATNKTIAKVASDFRKPRGFVVVEPGREAEFLSPLPLRTLPGLGPAAETALTGLGISTLGQLAKLPADILERRVGKRAGHGLRLRAAGVDDAPVSIPAAPKSVSREETFFDDIDQRAELHRRLQELAADVGSRLRHDHLAGRTITVKLRYHDFTNITRQHAVDKATNSDTAIAATATDLFDAAWNGTAVRLLGVGVSGIEDEAQLDLFRDRSPDMVVDRAIDAVRARFGTKAVARGAGRQLRDMDFRGDDLRKLGKK